MPAARVLEPAAPAVAKLPARAAVAQVLDTYILAVAGDGGLVVVDQHAAHERLTHEALREQVLAGGSQSSRCCCPPWWTCRRPTRPAAGAGRGPGGARLELEQFVPAPCCARAAGGARRALIRGRCCATSPTNWRVGETTRSPPGSRGDPRDGLPRQRPRRPAVEPGGNGRLLRQWSDPARRHLQATAGRRSCICRGPRSSDCSGGDKAAGF